MTEETYGLGRAAHDAGLERDPMKDHTFLSYIQTKESSEYHPSSPGSDMNSAQRRVLEEKIIDWKRGWDDAHQGK